MAEETQAKIKLIEKNIEGIKSRREGRIAALNSILSEEYLDEARKVMIASLKARIEGAKAEIGRQEATLFALRDGRSIKNATKLSKAEEQVRNYGIIVEALKRLEKRNWLDTKKLEKGLPLNCSLLQLIKGKM
ncbi:putative anti-sigma factor [Klebsiella phage PWKp16]|nr:putative anti-sigma factor [Klebsiella phage PWKp16]